MPDQDRESHLEKDREMLARVRELNGDVDKLLAEYQQDIGIETGQPGEFNQELSRIVLTTRDEYRSECRGKNRLECVFDIKCVFGCRFGFGFGCVFAQSKKDVPRFR